MSVISVLLESAYNRQAAGACGAGQTLASELGVAHQVWVAGYLPEAERQQVATVAKQVVVLEGLDSEQLAPEAVLNELTAQLESTGAQVIVLGGSAYTQEIGPRLAYRLNGASVGDAQAVGVSDGNVWAKRAVYGGKAMATISLRRSPAVVGVRARAMAPAEALEEAGSVESRPAAGSRDTKTALIERHTEAVEGVRLEDAPVIVSGGRGLGSAAPFDRLRALAGVMKAEVAASRAACDLGWVPHSLQVGQTGKKVAPELYLAIAMSGSSQHLMGIADAKTVAAINTDPEAPIFKHCRFGIVEDYDKVVDLLREKLSSKLG